MVSRREASSPSWRAVSTQWAHARKVAAALVRAGRANTAEDMLARIAAAIRREVEATFPTSGVPRGVQ